MRASRQATLLFLVLALPAARAVASVRQAPAEDVPVVTAPSVEEIQSRIDDLESRDLSDSETASAYRAAMDALASARQSQQRTGEFLRQTQEAPALLENVRAELAQPPTTADPDVPEGATLRDLEQSLEQAEADRAAAQRQVDDLNAEMRRRTERQTELPDEIAQARQRIDDAQEALVVGPTTDELGQARRVQLLAELDARRAELAALEAERSLYEARRELLPLRRDRAQRSLDRAARVADFWRDRAARARQAEADAAARAAERARADTARRFPELAEVAARNEQLASQRSGEDGAVKQIEAAGRDLEQERGFLDEVRARFRGTRRKIAVAGLTEGMGLLLRREYEWLPSPVEFRRRAAEVRGQLSRAQYQLIVLEEERDAAGDVGARLQKTLTESEPLQGIDESERAKLADVGRELLRTQRQLLDTSIQDYTTLINRLIDRQRNQELIAADVDAYRSYIEERVLWVPSTSLHGLFSPKDGWEGARWLVSPTEWTAALRVLRRTIAEQPFDAALLVVLLTVLLGWRRAVRHRVRDTAELVRSYRTDRFGLTVRALLGTVVLALPLPLTLWALGSLFVTAPDQVPVAVAAGGALRTLALPLFVLLFLLEAAKDKRLGDAHLRWGGPSMPALRAELRWFIPAAMTFEFVAVTFDRHGRLEWSDSIGRAAFMCGSLALALVLFRLFRPGRKLLSEFYRRNKGTLIERTQPLWLTLVVLVPVALALLSLGGYYYTAYRLQGSVQDTLALAIGLSVLYALLLRWLFIARRRLAIEQARQRAEARAAAEASAGTVRESGAVMDEDSVDIPAVDAQTRNLFRSGIAVATLFGMLLTWADALPALKALQRVRIWPSLAIVSAEDRPTYADTGLEPPAATQEPAKPAGSTASSETPRIAPPSSPGGLATGLLEAESSARPAAEDQPGVVITLADVGLALLLFLLTGIAARNVPGVLEMSLLRKLPLDSGSRYAVSTLCRYTLVIIGTTLAFGAMGVGWEKVQWLAAALTFGLAFGLQEIFANFVSGLILLIERPIRVGDMITVGGTEGRVTKLRMRATTVLDWDRREMIIPNKDFITSSITNWTLSDPITRIVIPVGVAYGSDTDRARDLLLAAARENPLVLEDPAPSAIFRRFGESSLDLELRVFIADRDYWPQVIDRLHTSIDEAFRKAEIEIAFPQRDLHIRSATVLEHRAEPSESD